MVQSKIWWILVITIKDTLLLLSVIISLPHSEHRCLIILATFRNSSGSWLFSLGLYFCGCINVLSRFKIFTFHGPFWLEKNPESLGKRYKDCSGWGHIWLFLTEVVDILNFFFLDHWGFCKSTTKDTKEDFKNYFKKWQDGWEQDV